MPNTPDADGYVDFGNVSRERLRLQCQYGSRYISGQMSYPNLGEGLRFRGNAENYHSLRIHQDDVEEFVRRVDEHRGQA